MEADPVLFLKSAAASKLPIDNWYGSSPVGPTWWCTEIIIQSDRSDGDDSDDDIDINSDRSDSDGSADVCW